MSGFVTLFWDMEFNFECPILDNEDPPEDNELPDPSRPLSKVIPLSSINSCNAEVSKVLK